LLLLFDVPAVEAALVGGLPPVDAAAGARRLADAFLVAACARAGAPLLVAPGLVADALPPELPFDRAVVMDRLSCRLADRSVHSPAGVGDQRAVRGRKERQRPPIRRIAG